MFLSSQKRENKLEFVYFALGIYRSLPIEHRYYDDYIHQFFRNVAYISLEEPKYQLQKGGRIDNMMDAYIATWAKASKSYIGSWDCFNCYYKKYHRVVYYALLGALIQSYFWCDEDEPMLEKDVIFYDLIIKELRLNKWEDYTKSFCRLETRKELATKLARLIETSDT